MNIVRKDLDQTNSTLTVSIVKADYAENVEKNLRDYRKRANFPGFRPGNIPMGLLKKMFGEAIIAEEINKQVQDALYKYIKGNDLNILGEPMVNQDSVMADFKNQEDFEFIFDIAFPPKFEVNLSDKDKVNYYTITVTDEMIENQVKSYTGRFGKYVHEDTVNENDMVKGELLEMIGGKVNESGIKVNDAVLTPAYMKDAAQKALFVGKKKGDVVVFNPQVAFENETEISSMLKISKDQAKKIQADFQMTINGITRYQESEINQELFDKVFGEGNVTTEKEFINRIKANIQEDLTSDSNYKFSLDAREMLSSKYKDITFPDEFLKRWLIVANEKLTPDMLEEEYPKIIRDLLWHQIKENIAKANDLKVEAADIEEYAKKVAKSQFAQYGMVGMDDSILDNYAKDMMKKEENIKRFSERALEEKVLAFVRNTVKLNKKDITIENFNKMLEADND